MRLRRVGLKLLLLLPALAIAAAAVPRLNSGIARERVFPESALVATNVALPASSYAVMAASLEEAPLEDGEIQILKAEAEMGAGRSRDLLIPRVKDALARAPGDARGWILLASLERDHAKAAKALALALKLAPREYYLIAPETVAGAGLWNDLPDGARRLLVSDARLMATDPNRRSELYTLVAKPEGAALVTRALKGDPAGIRKLNNDIARQTLHLP